MYTAWSSVTPWDEIIEAIPLLKPNGIEKQRTRSLPVHPQSGSQTHSRSQSCEQRSSDWESMKAPVFLLQLGMFFAHCMLGRLW